ncbi:hypothetical protein [Frigidibacter sp. ROC022]|uniref:hypothetical protein n=1 Tax=Frigidibacter sp. ROC022 TaxID=2971796 RepID=UPI00215A6483|nr:hypothetical protein [Frigidibacter sp. ROC022]MCR8724203.1 hypothetical protein [Frigidibacter sp. ROC022]
MSLKRISAVLATTALVAAGGIALAQDKTGENVTKEAPAAEGVVADFSVAQKLYQWGVAHDSAVAVAAAAEMLKSIDVKDVDREVVQAAIEGADTAEEGEGADAPVSLEDMLAKAKELAGDDAEMLGMIDDIEMASSKGRIGGASRTLSRLPAGYNDTYRVPFYGNSLAELAIVGDGDADLDLLVTDENGNTICYDTSYSDQLYCAWTPRWDGYFIITVKNMGRVRNSYYLLTN